MESLFRTPDLSICSGRAHEAQGIQARGKHEISVCAPENSVGPANRPRYAVVTGVTTIMCPTVDVAASCLSPWPAAIGARSLLCSIALSHSVTHAGQLIFVSALTVSCPPFLP